VEQEDWSCRVRSPIVHR